MTTSTAHDPVAGETLSVPPASVVEVPAAAARPSAAFRWGRLRRVLGAAAFVAALACLVLLRPVALGGSFSHMIVAGDSMKPEFQNGDIVITERQGQYRRGDVVAYSIPAGDVGAGRLVIHRVVGGDAARGYVLKGDNRRRPDVWRPRAADVRGKVRLHVPGTGQVLVRLMSPAGLALACALVVFLIVSCPTRARA